MSFLSCIHFIPERSSLADSGRREADFLITLRSKSSCSRSFAWTVLYTSVFSVTCESIEILGYYSKSDTEVIPLLSAVCAVICLLRGCNRKTCLSLNVVALNEKQIWWRLMTTYVNLFSVGSCQTTGRRLPTYSRTICLGPSVTWCLPTDRLPCWWV